MPPKVSVKRKREVLTLAVKREIIEKLEAGHSANSLMTTYGIAKSTLYDLRRAAQSATGPHEIPKSQA